MSAGSSRAQSMTLEATNGIRNDASRQMSRNDDHCLKWVILCIHAAFARKRLVDACRTDDQQTFSKFPSSKGCRGAKFSLATNVLLSLVRDTWIQSSDFAFLAPLALVVRRPNGT